MKISNRNDISLVAAVWAVTDEYDYINDPKYFSVTTLLKPTQEIVLRKRLAKEDTAIMDVEDLLASALGNSIHSSVENAWTKHYKNSLKLLGYDQHTIDQVLINPEPKELTDTCIPVYVEQRSFKEFEGFRVGGKFDIVIEGSLYDIKSTSVYSWIYGSKVNDYQLQGSIYRWLNPEIITSDYITIVYVFTDWSKSSSKTNSKYPPNRIAEVKIKLLSLEDTEKFIKDKLQEIDYQSTLDSSSLKHCSNEELWMKEITYKYYSDPNKTNGRSTKNFTSEIEANNYMASKGKGVILRTDPLPTRCDYCSVKNICLQRSAMLNNLLWEDQEDLT